MGNDGPVNKFELQGVLDEDPKIHNGQYSDFGNFVVRFACVKKGEFGKFKGSCMHQTSVDKLKSAKAGDGILIKGRLSEDHYEWKGKAVATKKLAADEIWIMRAAGSAAPVAPTPVAPQASPTPVPEDTGPPPSAADVPSDPPGGQQWT